MKMEEANEIWNERDKTFEINGYVVSRHKTTDMLQSAEAIIAARDARIAELDKEVKALRTCIIDRGSEIGNLESERDEARKDAVEVADIVMRIYDDSLWTIYSYKKKAFDIKDKYE